MSTSRPTSLQDFAALNAELAALVRARIPLEASLRRLSRQLPRGAGALAKRLAERMERGASLAEAINEEGDRLPDVYKSIVTVGLESGQPAAALDTVSNSAARLATLRQTTGIALIVPLFVVTLACTLFAFLLQKVFIETIWVAPESLVWLKQCSQSPALQLLLVTVIPTMVGIVPLVWWFRTRSARGMSLSGWSMLGWIPGARRLHRLNASATFAEVLRMGITAGLPWSHSMRSAGQASGDRRFRNAADVVADALERGDSLTATDDAKLAKSLRQLPSLVRVALKSIQHRPTMQAALNRAAQSYLRRAEMLHASLISWLPAVLTLSIGGTVTAAYALALMWPYTEMLRTMAGALWK